MDNEHPNLELDAIRIEKLQKIRDLGINPYPYKFTASHIVAQVREQFKEIQHEPSSDKITLAGRILIIRSHGKTMFCDIRDESGQMQLFIRINELGEQNFNQFRDFIDPGDFVGVEGRIFRTKKGEITLWVEKYTILSKSLCLLPEKFHGLKDVQKRYRQRYIDLIVNDTSRQIFRTRSKLIINLRKFLDERGFLEFETPILQPLYGGANARPFTTYHNFLSQTLYLRIAPELYLKRIAIGGFEKIYEIARNFRNEDIDTKHNPEFTMIEIYQAYQDYNDMMILTEDILSTLTAQVHEKTTVEFDNKIISFAKPFAKMTMVDAVKEYGELDVYAHTVNELRDIARQNRFEDSDKPQTLGEFLVYFFDNMVEEKLEQPTFIYDFPIENSPLAKRHRDPAKSGFTERFELFVNGMELANGFSELNDPIDQKERFEDQERRKNKDDEAMAYDTDFINALGYGLPPTGGVGIGIDRFVMFMTNNLSIKEVILFPQMKSSSVETNELEEADKKNE
jgi:lysyl-tRNA synthetase class 2